MALSGQVIDFIRSNFKEHRDQAVDIKDVAIVHMKLQGSYNFRAAASSTSVDFLIQAMHK